MGRGHGRLAVTGGCGLGEREYKVSREHTALQEQQSKVGLVTVAAYSSLDKKIPWQELVIVT